MDELKYILGIMQKDLDGLKENLVRGQYRERDLYFGVLGEAKILIKMINETERLIAKREENDFDGDDDGEV